MAQRCDICGKGTLYGHHVSHAHNLSKRVWNPNLQRVRALQDGKVRTLRVCTRCLKGNRVQKAPRRRVFTATG
jgi:large subunit ribosomal protein L28